MLSAATFFRLLGEQPELCITQIIQESRIGQEPIGVHGLLKQCKLFTHKYIYIPNKNISTYNCFYSLKAIINIFPQKTYTKTGYLFLSGFGISFYFNL